jgi:predicted Zn finger-like uncharacterized protein
MIVECEKCQTRFSLNENLLKKTGSRVRCSACKHVFTVFPIEEDAYIEEPLSERVEKQPTEKELTADFEKTLAEEIEEDIAQEEKMEPISIDDLPDLGKEHGELGEKTEIDKAIDQEIKEKKAIEEDTLKKEQDTEDEAYLSKPPEIIKKRRRSGLWTALLLIALLIAGAVATLFVSKPDFLFKKTPPEQQTIDKGNIRLAFKDIKGFFKESDKAGRLFVVKGLVINNYPESRGFVRIRSNIIDSKGKIVQSKTVYAGNPISDDELLSLSMEEITSLLMNKLGKAKMNVNILPRSSIPFIVIFGSLPHDMNEFTVEAISSFPSGK